MPDSEFVHLVGLNATQQTPFTSLEQYCSERYTRLFHSTMLNSIYYLKTLLELYYHALLTTRGRHKRYTMCTGRDRKEKSLFTAHIF